MFDSRMMVALILAGFSILVSGCDGEPSCDELFGMYEGDLEGDFPFYGRITLTVAHGISEGMGLADVTGTWTGEDGYFGAVNRSDLDCGTGDVSYDNGFSLLGPDSVVSPPGMIEASAVTLGEFRGTLTPSGGSGWWEADSGAWLERGVEARGTWTVRR